MTKSTQPAPDLINGVSAYHTSQLMTLWQCSRSNVNRIAKSQKWRKVKRGYWIAADVDRYIKFIRPITIRKRKELK